MPVVLCQWQKTCVLLIFLQHTGLNDGCNYLFLHTSTNHNLVLVRKLVRKDFFNLFCWLSAYHCIKFQYGMSFEVRTSQYSRLSGTNVLGQWNWYSNNRYSMDGNTKLQSWCTLKWLFCCAKFSWHFIRTICTVDLIPKSFVVLLFFFFFFRMKITESDCSSFISLKKAFK